MRTNNNWKVVEPIIESENIEEQCEIVDIEKNIKYWNPDPLFSIDTLIDDLTL